MCNKEINLPDDVKKSFEKIKFSCKKCLGSMIWKNLKVFSKNLNGIV